MRAKIKGGKIRYVPLLPKIAEELKHYPMVISDDRILTAAEGSAWDCQDW